MTDLYVPGDEIADRFERLKIVIDRSALGRNSARVGRLEEAIVEGPSRKDPEVLSGRTRQGKLVHFVAPGTAALDPGTFVTVHIDHGAPHHLAGTFVSAEGVSRSRERVRIPVVAG